ncbi:MAG: hypothetical protein L7F77_06585 [Candidatus Magnetominusculus sp. LBB02]|nr:hypothetical protein [Candidatus Magnetominusculus sp. LBB02]
MADLTEEEFTALVGKVIEEKFRELLADPDYGLELRDEFVKDLDASISARERIPFDDVINRLGFDRHDISSL